MRGVPLAVKTGGAMDSARSYGHVLPIRALISTDGTVVNSFAFGRTFLAKTATPIINEVCGINRVVYEVASKPPG